MVKFDEVDYEKKINLSDLELLGLGLPLIPVFFIMCIIVVIIYGSEFLRFYALHRK